MNPIVSFVKSRPLLAFFVLAYAISWSASVGYALGVFPLPILAFGPFLSAIIVTALADGRRGVKTLLLRPVQWRVGLMWYAVALLLPAVITATAFGANLLLGAPNPSGTQLGGWPIIFASLSLFMVMPLSGPFGEELGWRGFALPRLQARYTALVASLIIGVLTLGWHVPWFVFQGIPVGNIPLILASAIVFTWLFNNTKGSVLPVMLAHSSWNAVAGFFFPMFSGADLERWYWLMGILWSAVAVGLVLVAGVELSRKPSPKVQTQVEAPVTA
jgi:uncharacterized protein